MSLTRPVQTSNLGAYELQLPIKSGGLKTFPPAHANKTEQMAHVKESDLEADLYLTIK
jgi:hypothetical protein